MERTDKRREAEVKIPVIEEQVHAGKRTVEKGKVRIRKEVEEEDIPIMTPLIEEDVEIEKIPINKYIDDDVPPSVRQEGDTMIISVVEEVVEKRLILREEYRITKRKEEYTVKDSVKVKKEKVRVEKD